MMASLRRWWSDTWFHPSGRISLVALRVIVVLQALWILASRPDLPTVAGWPVEFWKVLPATLLLRFGYLGLHPLVERILYAALFLLLIAVLLGFQIRVSALAAGLLLYHFAPLDSLLASGDFISMSGLTIPTLMLFVIWAVDATASESSDYRWPVRLAQLLLALSFFLSGVMKLRYVGWSWYTGANVRQLALATWSLSARPAALWLATHYAAAWLVAMGSAVLDSLFIAAFFWRPLLWIVLLMAVVTLPLRSMVFGYHWLAGPLLFVFVDWDLVRSRCVHRGFLRV